MSSHVNTDQELRRRANTIAIASAVIAAVAAVASVLSFAVPTGIAYFNDKRHEKDLVAALASSDWSTARTAQEHVVEESSADQFIQNMDAWWYSADWAGDGTDPKPKSGSVESVDDGYRVCLPKLLPGEQVCAQYDEFVHDPSSGLVTSFSVDGIPAGKLAWSMSGEDVLTTDDGAPLSAVPTFRVEFPSQALRCVSYRLDNDTEETIYFRPREFEVQDLELKKARGRVLWADKLGKYETAVTTLCVPDSGGFVKIQRKTSGKDKSTTMAGWIRVE